MSIFGKKKKEGEPTSQPELPGMPTVVYENKTHKNKGGRPTNDRSSNGPIAANMPVFGPDGQEIMTVQHRRGANTVVIFTEDSFEPGKLNPTEMPVKQYDELLRSQPKAGKNQG
jgi:hypothetical protein